MLRTGANIVPPACHGNRGGSPAVRTDFLHGPEIGSTHGVLSEATATRCCRTSSDCRREVWSLGMTRASHRALSGRTFAQTGDNVLAPVLPHPAVRRPDARLLPPGRTISGIDGFPLRIHLGHAGHIGGRSAARHRVDDGAGRLRQHTLQSDRRDQHLGQRPWGIAVTPDGRKLYTANGLSGDVSVIDVGLAGRSPRPVTTIRTGDGPWGVVIGR